MGNAASKAFMVVQLPEAQAPILFGFTLAVLIARFVSGYHSLIGDAIIFLCGLLFTARIASGKYIPSSVPLPDLKDKTVIITGGNTGIGKETAAQLAELGAKVIIACRNKDKAEQAIFDIKKRTNESTRPLDIEYRKLDLSSMASVQQFVEEWKGAPLHILINNAGVMMSPYTQTADGLELQFGTNHVGHFLLTTKLLPFIQPAGRIINLSSIAHIKTPSVIDWNDFAVSDKKKYNPTVSYAVSKLANIYFTTGLQRKADLQGNGIIACSVHPGVVRTELVRHFNSILVFLASPLSTIFMKSPLKGAQTSYYCAIAPADELIPGGYYTDCGESPPSRQARKEKEAKRLWDFTEELIQQRTPAKAKPE